MKRDRNNVLAGLFVVGGLVLAFGLVIMISNFENMFVGTQELQVRYHLNDGLRGLKEGAIVTIGDVPAGQVVAIEDQGTDDVVTHRIVTFTIPDKYTLYDNASIELNRPALGENTKLNIQSFGNASRVKKLIGKSPKLEPGEVIDGGIAGSHLTASAIKDLGIEAKQKDDIRNIIANLSDITDELNGKPPSSGKAPGPLSQTLESLRMVSQQLSGKMKEGKFHELLTKLSDTTEYLNKIMNALASGLDDEMDLQAVQAFLPSLGHTAMGLKDITGALAEGARTDAESLKKMLPNLAKFSEDLAASTGDLRLVMDKLGDGVRADEDVFKDLLANLKKASADIAEVTQGVRETTMNKINAALDQANAAMDDVKDTTDNLKTLLTSQRPVLERTLANTRLVSDQLKLASIEIRRSPWRLFYKPDEKELNTDNLYDAARSFALAAGTLDSTAESIRVLMERHGDKIDPDDPKFQAMLQNLRDTFSKYESTEKKFWEALNKLEK